MRQMYKLLMLVCLIFPSIAFAQSETNESDRQVAAYWLFKFNEWNANGKYKEVLDQIGRLYNQNWTELDLFELYRFEALAYFALSDKESCYKAIKKMLTINPGYLEFPYADPAEFRLMAREFSIRTRFECSSFGGISLMQPAIGATADPIFKDASVKSNLNYFLGFKTSYYFLNHWGIYAGLGVENMDFKVQTAASISPTIQWFEGNSMVVIPYGINYVVHLGRKFRLMSGIGLETKFRQSSTLATAKIDQLNNKDIIPPAISINQARTSVATTGSLSLGLHYEMTNIGFGCTLEWLHAWSPFTTSVNEAAFKSPLEINYLRTTYSFNQIRIGANFHFRIQKWIYKK